MSEISEMIHDGGMAMYSTLLWGLLGLAYATFAAARPTRARLGFVSGLQTTVLGSSMVGTIFGLIGVSRAYHGLFEEGDVAKHGTLLLVEGAGEAFSNLALGFVMFTLMAFVGAFGRLRME